MILIKQYAAMRYNFILIILPNVIIFNKYSNTDCEKFNRFYRRLKWDYGVLGDLTPVISWCCILCYDHA